MAYSLVAIGWVPNMDECITSEENISRKLESSPKRGGLQFVLDGRRVVVKKDLGNYPIITIQLMDDTGLCHMFIDSETGWGDTNRHLTEILLMNVWMTFRGLIDNTIEPGYAQSGEGSYNTKVARFAICSAMNAPIFVSELKDMDEWADAILERFAKNYNTIFDLFRTYPKKYRYWSNPDHLWNRRKVIDRAMNLFTMASTDSDCCHSFVSIYSGRITDPRIETKLNIRDKRLETISRFVEGHMESTNLGWLLASIIIALAIGISSLVSGLWPR